MPSPIDELFLALFGFLPTKPGTAYELLSAGVCKLLGESRQVFQDARIRGTFSETLYQIDVLERQAEKGVAGEAKDYSETGNPVGRGDLQKLGGALGELPVESGRFFSATEYTKPARKYATAAEKIVGKPISLYHVRTSSEADLDGRVQRIIVRLSMILPDYDAAEFMPVWTPEGRTQLRAALADGSLTEGAEAVTEVVFASDRTVLARVRELTTVLGGTEERAEGSFWLPGGYLDVLGSLVPVHGITYKIPMRVTPAEEIIIEANGVPCVLVRAEDGSVNRLLTDSDLKRVEFGEDGQVTLKPGR